MSDNPVDIVAKLLDPHYGTLEATKMMMRMEAAQIIETLRKPPMAREISRIDKDINAVHTQLRRYEKIDTMSAASWHDIVSIFS